MKINKKIKLISFSSGLFFSGFVYAAMYGGGPAETWTNEQIAALATSVNSDIAAFGTTLGTQITSTFEILISAVAVATKQEAVSGSTVADSIQQSSAQFLNAQTAQNTNNQITEAWINYSGATGQGFDPCGTLAKNQSLDKAFGNAQSQVQKMINQQDNAPGRLVNRVDALTKRYTTHKNKFCTDSEAKAGVCSKSNLPGGDSNGALLFTAADPDSLESQGRTAFIQNVIGEPDQVIAQSAGQTSAGQAYGVAKIRKDALLSIPAYSLQTINVANTRSTNFQGKSPNEMLQARVNQYFGGSEAEDWSQSLTHQSPRGLLVEGVKMDGMDAWIQFKTYQQNQRLIANLAALQMSAVSPLQALIDAQANELLRINAAKQIK